jgi:hypothetical protein
VPTRQRVSRLAVRDSGGKFLVLHRRAEGTAWLTWPHPPQNLVPLLPHAMLEHSDSAFGSSEVDMLNVPTELNVHAYGVHATSTSISSSGGRGRESGLSLCTHKLLISPWVKSLTVMRLKVVDVRMWWMWDVL